MEYNNVEARIVINKGLKNDSSGIISLRYKTENKNYDKIR